MDGPLEEAQVEPLYRLHLKALKIRPLARPDPTQLVHHPRYCAYHQFVGHPTGKCRALKERLDELIQAGVIKLSPRRRQMIAASRTSARTLRSQVKNQEGSAWP